MVAFLYFIILRSVPFQHQCLHPKYLRDFKANGHFVIFPQRSFQPYKMSSAELVKVRTTQFGDIVYFSATAESGEELVWTGLADRPRKYKLVPKEQVMDPMIALFVVDADCGPNGESEALEKRGQVIKPGASLHLRNLIRNKFVSCATNTTMRELEFKEKEKLSLSFSVYTTRPVIGAGIKENDEIAIHGRDGELAMTLGHDFWFKGKSADKWVIRRYEEYAKETSEARYGRIYKLRASNSMFLSVLPNFNNSATFILSEEEQSAECLSHPDAQTFPEYKGSLRADLTSDADDANNCWVMEREDAFTGGLLRSEEKFFLKHVASRKYLSNDLSLVVKSQASLFTFMSVDGEGNIGFGEAVDLVGSEGGVIGLDYCSSDSLQARVFQKVTSDLPSETVMRHALVGTAVQSAVSSLKFEVQHVPTEIANEVSILAAISPPLALCRTALQNIKKLADVAATFQDIDKMFDNDSFEMGNPSMANRALAASDMQIVLELLRVYLLKTKYSKEYKEQIGSLKMFNSGSYVFYSGQYTERGYQTLLLRKNMLSTMLLAMPIQTTDVLGYGLIRITPSASLRQYWTEFCMTMKTADKGAEDYCEIFFFLQRLLFGLEFSLPATGLYTLKNNADKFYVEFFPDDTLRFNETTKVPEEHDGDSLYYSRHTMFFVRCIATNPIAREEVISGMGLTLENALRFYRSHQNLYKFTYVLLSYATTAFVGTETGREAASNFLQTHVLSWQELAKPQEIDQTQWFFFPRPQSLIAGLVKDEVYFWLSTKHELSDDSSYWFPSANAHLFFALKLIEHDAVSDIFVASVLSAAAGLLRWVLNQPIEGFSDRFPDLSKSKWAATNPTQTHLDAFLQLVGAYHRWKKMKVLRKLAAMGKNSVSIEEIRNLVAEYDFNAIIARYEAQFGVPKPGSLLADSGDTSPLLTSLKKLVSSPLVKLEGLLYYVFTKPDLRPKSHLLNLLRMVDDEIDMASSIAAFLDESFSEQPFISLIPMVKNIQQYRLSHFELETLPTESVQGLAPLVEALNTLTVFMLELSEHREANKNFQLFLNKLDFNEDLQRLWEWGLSLSAASANEPLGVQLRTLTVELTRLYIHSNIQNRKEVLDILPVQAFYATIPQYIQLLKELDLLDSSGDLACSLATQAFLEAGQSDSPNSVQTLKELMINQNATNGIAFTVIDALKKTEREALSHNEWEVIIALMKNLKAEERLKWFKPIIEKFHAKSPDGIRKEIAALYALSTEVSSELFTRALAALETQLTALNTQSIEALLPYFKCVRDLQRRKYTLYATASDDIAFVLETLWDGLIATLGSDVPKANAKTAMRELSKLFLSVTSLEPFAGTLFPVLKTYYETPDLGLEEADQELGKRVLGTTLPGPSTPEGIAVALPSPVVLVTGERNSLRPCLQRLFAEEAKTVEVLKGCARKIKKSEEHKTITKDTFSDLEKWFPPKYFEDEYLQACEKAANLIVPELLAGKEDTLLPVIEVLFDLAVHRGSDVVTKDVLEIIVGVVKRVDQVRSHFLGLLKRRRYYLQVFGLFSDIVARHKVLKALIANVDNAESEQRQFWSDDYEKNTNALLVFLSLFQYCCDGCNTPFQDFLRDQEEGLQNNINIITLATSLFTDVLADFSKPSERSILEGSGVMLLESVSGPCSANQAAVCGFPKFLDNLVAFITSLGKDAPISSNVMEAMPEILKLVLALLEGRERNSEAIEKIMGSVDFDIFKTLALKEANTLNQDILRALSLGTGTEEQQKNFDLAVLCFLVCFNTLSDASLQDFKPLPITRFISSVEIEATDPATGEPVIRFLSFAVPLMARYLTSETSMRLLFDIDRESRQVKLDDFTSKVPVCEVEMAHQQSIARFKCLKIITNWWKYYWYISFTLSVIINAMLVFIVEVTDDSRFSIPKDWSQITILLEIGQLTTSILGTVSFYIEYFYTFKTNFKLKEESTEMEKLPAIACPGSSLSSYLQVKTNSTGSSYNLDQLLKAAIRIGYSVGAVAAFWHPYIYPFLLFQIINLNDSVVNILRSVTQRGSQLALTFLFALISIYAFTLIAYFYLYAYYDPEAGLFCDSLANCFLSTVNLGMRSGGGIGDAFGPASEETYSIRLVFDLMFYICITTVLMAIVFGLIVDTFSELRDERNSIEFDMNNVCLICGLSRSVIELKGEGWQKHTIFVHNPFAYLYFLIHVKQTDINDCTGIEKMVKEKLAVKDITFYPTTSRELGFEAIASE